MKNKDFVKIIKNAYEPFTWLKMNLIDDINDVYQCIDDNHTYLIIPKIAGVILGAGDFHLMVLPKYRGKGYGDLMIKTLIDYHKLDLNHDNYNLSCTIVTEKHKDVVEHLLIKNKFEFTNSLYRKHHGGMGGEPRMKWRYFYQPRMNVELT